MNIAAVSLVVLLAGVAHAQSPCSRVFGPCFTQTSIGACSGTGQVGTTLNVGGSRSDIAAWLLVGARATPPLTIPLTNPNCAGSCRAVLVQGTVVAGSGYPASWALPIPNSTSLRGLRVDMQIVGIENGFGCLAAKDGFFVTIR